MAEGRWNRVLGVVVVFWVAGVLGCVKRADQAVELPEPPFLLTSSEVLERYGPAVVRIDVYEWGRRKPGGGTGFLITRSGYILTCAHILETNFERTAIKVIRMDRSGREIRPELPASVVKLSKEDQQFLEEKDIALLKVSDDDFPFLKLANSQDVEAGEPLIYLGYPEDSLKQETLEGVLSAIHFRNRESSLPTFRTSLPFVPGNSGGPVLNHRGEVIGVAESVLRREGTPSEGYAIPINFFYPLLGKARVKLPLPRSGSMIPLKVSKASRKILWQIGQDDESYGEFAPDLEVIPKEFNESYAVGRQSVALFPRSLDSIHRVSISLHFHLTREEARRDLSLILDTAGGRGGEFLVGVLLERPDGEDPYYVGTYAFDTGAGKEFFPARYEVSLAREWLRPGENILVLRNDNQGRNRHSIYWDQIALQW
ncbi:MAG: trypsin-like peptidase domain-containing protein [Candidatus Tectomicrobia bacterium]|uniref:Trypsin-like peptidase domain-containing protein n=1 Tax=Tectimicrobiota bacterium TaxID=2528274 RepID=A0A932CQ51_UNCTE|nr:trypsin-like peptidase domain-containing protein [Candidatus Tectomicrobia bacterium]